MAQPRNARRSSSDVSVAQTLRVEETLRDGIRFEPCTGSGAIDAGNGGNVNLRVVALRRSISELFSV